MHLLLNPNGSRWWRRDYRFDGKRKTISLGVYPEIGLAEARERREEAHKLIDPSKQKKTEKQARIAEQERQTTAMRFSLDSDGALSIRLGKRHLDLTSDETHDLLRFLNTA